MSRFCLTYRRFHHKAPNHLKSRIARMSSQYVPAVSPLLESTGSHPAVRVVCTPVSMSLSSEAELERGRAEQSLTIA